MNNRFRLQHTVLIAATTGLLFTAFPSAAFASDTVTTVLSTTTQTAAQTVSTTEITQDKAIAAAKAFYPIPADYSMSNASYQAPNKYSPWVNGVWNIDFQGANQNSGFVPRMQNSLHFSVDAKNGNVISFFAGYANSSSNPDNAISREEGQRIATGLVKKLAPEQASSVRLIGSDASIYSPDPSVKSYTFERIVNGIPYTNNNITIQLDSAGKLRGYQYNWSDSVTFPSEKPAVTADQAQSIYSKSLQVALMYTVNRFNRQNGTNATLVYAPIGTDGISSFPVIDANSGQLIDQTGKVVTSVNPPVFPAISGDQPVAPTGKELTKEQVQDIVKLYPLNLDQYDLQSLDYQSQSGNGSPDSLWQFSYNKKGTNESIHFTVDAKTGDLVQFSRPMFGGPVLDTTNNTVKIPYEQAKQIAINWIQKTLPSEANAIALDPSSAYTKSINGAYSFRFVPLHDGIPCDNYLNVNINGSTGEVDLFFAQTFPDIKYPSKDQITITTDKAKQEYLNNSQFKLILQYMPIFDSNQPAFGQPSKVALVYAPYTSKVPMQQLDALSGNWVSPFTTTSDLSKITDLKGNWAEKYLATLYLKGAIQPIDNKLLPNKAVTRSEAVRALVALVGVYSQVGGERPFFQDVKPDNPDYSNIQQAARDHWISTDDRSFHPNDTLTREDLAAWISTALGYTDLTKVAGAVSNHFTDVSDISSEYANDIGIASALGLMVGSDGKFRPHDAVTRAEMAVVMTRLADRLQKKGYYW